MENSKKLLKNSPSARRADKIAKQVQSSQPDAKLTHALVSKLHSFLTQHLSSQPKLLVALSGGLDSCVLLHLLAEVKHLFLFELQAMHVHHGLSPNADAWTELCAKTCEFLHVPLQVVYVNVDPSSKQGIEAAARELRYQALFNHKFGEILPDYVVTAHHQDDQAETLLLQLLRGAGVKGLSSMAALDETRRLLRPLLDVPRLALKEYAVQHQIEWCEDESNDNTQYERNFVRHNVMPVLETHFPSAKSVIARTASHLAEANSLLDTLATLDARELLLNNSLCLQGLSQLDIPRAKNVLRWWFAQNQLAMPNAEHLTEIIQQLLNAKPDADVNIKLQHLTLRRYQYRAHLYADRASAPFDLTWCGESTLTLPDGSRLLFSRKQGVGLALKYSIDKLRIAHRTGGERFKPNVLRPTRTLKHLLQEASIPPWVRSHLPLVYWQDTLAYVPGIGVASGLQAGFNEIGLEIIWQDS
ncbi:MAG: tRNA lysidine(34) synthetase TilS [Methylotenera sp.]|nr:tRNA lysidine(34) synthetase TilS [Methylotenera sp.]MDP1754402.1 tRNA lysidine(34) synthetase TilS [Methylotenera sp.]MDP1959514.1 tRNA lysidine(34) synthetase TilS [Methylotenera sp.]MDP3206878.1 tRNA lysidine(34) synthetase TilS [Methylotenera sp.]MDP3303085.1 tRNA lysidine(34) synthetase TilS [Methylotenera sp.]